MLSVFAFVRFLAFVNRRSGLLFSSAVQGPAPLAQDEPLAEMHLHALCRYPLFTCARCLVLTLKSAVSTWWVIEEFLLRQRRRRSSLVDHLADSTCVLPATSALGSHLFLPGLLCAFKSLVSLKLLYPHYLLQSPEKQRVLRIC